MTALSATNHSLILETFIEATLSAVAAIEPLHKKLSEGSLIINSKDSAIYQDGKELVTEADILSDSILAEILNQAFPDIPSVREEEQASHLIHSDRYFTVDGLDGTICFAGKYPGAESMWGILLAYFENAQPQLASIYLRKTKEIITINQSGFFVAGERLKLPKPCQTVTVAMDVGPWQPANVENYIIPKLQAAGIKLVTDRPSAAGLADYLIRGQADAWITRVARIWDVAPCAVAVQAMGGVVLPLYQERLVWDVAYPEPAIYARSKAVADLLLELLLSLPEAQRF